MKILRKKCVRCGQSVDSAFVDRAAMVYTCPACDSVSSVFEERDFISEKRDLKQPEGIRYAYKGDDLHIYLDQLPTGEVTRSLVGTSLILLFFLLLFWFTDSTIFLWITIVLGGLGWVINVLAYTRLENRTYEIVLDPYTVIFFEQLAGIKRKLKELGSYEVDRIQVVTRENHEVPGKNRTDFILQTKQYEQVKPFYHTSSREAQLAYLKFLMDSYLNIRERLSDIQH
jgi:hypothetical protein